MATDRETLEKWIAETERNRRRLGKLLAPGALAGLALLLWSRVVGGGVLLLVGLVALFGYWIMASHLVDFHTRLEELGRPRPVGRAVRRK